MFPLYRMIKLLHIYDGMQVVYTHFIFLF